MRGSLQKHQDLRIIYYTLVYIHKGQKQSGAERRRNGQAVSLVPIPQQILILEYYQYRIY